MERQRELLAGTIWRSGTRIQTGWWFASLGRILEAQDELDEEQIAAICGQSRPLHDLQGQLIVFRLHAGECLGAETPEERREWIVTLLTAFRIEWNNSLQRRDDMVSQGKEEMLDIGNLVTERYRRACRRHAANQVSRRRAKMRTADDRHGAEGPATVPEMYFFSVWKGYCSGHTQRRNSKDGGQPERKVSYERRRRLQA